MNISCKILKDEYTNNPNKTTNFTLIRKIKFENCTIEFLWKNNTIDIEHFFLTIIFNDFDFCINWDIANDNKYFCFEVILFKIFDKKNISHSFTDIYWYIHKQIFNYADGNLNLIFKYQKHNYNALLLKNYPSKIFDDKKDELQFLDFYKLTVINDTFDDLIGVNFHIEYVIDEFTIYYSIQIYSSYQKDDIFNKRILGVSELLYKEIIIFGDEQYVSITPLVRNIKNIDFNDLLTEKIKMIKIKSKNIWIMNAIKNTKLIKFKSIINKLLENSFFF